MSAVHKPGEEGSYPRINGQTECGPFTHKRSEEITNLRINGQMEVC